ncbi:MAG: nucleotide exchange factor GrpE [Lachnospiraceae bacterium]|nr:nucleotide exchange factor GrpE [Lachnospiraceae bacterium]
MEEQEKLKEKEEDKKAEEVEEAAEELTEEKQDEEKTKEAGKEQEEADKKKHHGKKDKKEKKDPRDEKIADLEDRVKRQMAEFENFRKRTEKEKAQMFDMGAKSVIEKILPVIDNFERGLSNIPEGSDGAFVNGMQMIYKQMTDELEKIGVKQIEAVGQPFDPNFHNAVMQVESEEYESGTVAQELQKGYMYHDTLVRPSMVGVVQ